MIRAAVTLVLVMILLARPSAPALGQAVKVDMHLRLAPGEALPYAFTETEQSSVTGPQGRTAATAKVEGVEVYRVLGRDATGAVTVEIFQDTASVTRAGKTEQAWRIPLTIQVSQFGVVLSRVSGIAPKPEDFPMPLPDGQVAVGDTWRRQRAVEAPGVDGKVTRLYRLVSLDRGGEETVAQIRVDESAVVAVRPSAFAIPGLRVVSSGKLQGSGEVSWSLERGRVLKASTQTTLEVQADVRSQAESVRVTVVSRTTRERELLPRVPVPALGPEELIIPGRSLGKFTVGSSMADLVASFGQPVEEPDLGLVSRRLRWPNGLVVHLSTADPAGVLALEMTDPRYRTEKGVGYRSSEGAVRLAYGLDPRSVELVSVRLGGYRLLTYDDLGIAFGVRADNYGTMMGRMHPPIGTVEFVVIFPPGTASRILSQ